MDRRTARRQRFGDLDAPGGGHAPASLAPLPSRITARSQRVRRFVDKLPGDLSHATYMGQLVPLVKDDMSPEKRCRNAQNGAMSEWITQAQFNDALCARTQTLRLERDWTQAQMATALGIAFESYKKYETRTPLPHYLLPRFAQLVDRDVEYVLTGRAATAVRRSPRRLVRTGTDG